MWIDHVRLLPELSGGVAAQQGSVQVEEGRITAVCQGNAPTGAEDVIDGGGRTLLPGLIDAHTHIACLRGFDSCQLRDPLRFFTDTCLFTQRYLDYGFTTIRDCGVPLRVANAARDAVERGLFTGPHILASGLILSPTEVPEDDGIRDMYTWVDSPDQGRRAARKELAQQADFVKVMASGSALHKHGVPVQPILTEPELSTIVEAAALKGSYVAAHAHGDGAIRLCVDCGVRTIEHASYISEETIDALLHTGNTWLIPTISAMYQNPETTSAAYQYLVEKLRRMMEQSGICLRRAYEAGVPMGFGTDSCPGMDQYEQGLEFLLRREVCGMKDRDILMQATLHNARALGIDGETGAIRPGLRADLLLVDGAPEEDISVLCRRPDMVFVDGCRVRG